MNFHEFGLGIGWVQVLLNVVLTANGVLWGIRLLIAIFNGLE